MAKKVAPAYDIYLIRTSGIPLFAGCSQNDYCMARMGQHELQAGFLAAINAFSKEAFENEKIHTIFMDNIQINFLINENDGLIFAVIHEKDQDTNFIKKRLKDAYDVFINRYPEAKDETVVQMDQFSEIQNILKQLGLVENRLGNTLEMQFEEKVRHSRKRRLFNWVKGLMSAS